MMGARSDIVCGYYAIGSQLLLNAEIELVGIRPLHVRVGIPLKAAERGGWSNRWPRATGGLR